MSTLRPDRSIGSRLAMAAALVVGTASLAVAGTVEVKLSLPVRAQIDLSGRSSITIVPCMIVTDEGQETSSEIDLQREFERYVSRLVTRRTPLKFIESGPIDYPTYDLEQLGRDQDFWAFVGERTQADLVMACSLDFDVQDRSGYRTEEYTSPYDGRTYYRQVLVENTGFEFDIVLQILDGRTGEMLFSDNFKDFRQLDQGDADPVQGMFSNLYALEDRITGIFAQRRIQARRTLYTN